jgi:hypothetical protein
MLYQLSYTGLGACNNPILAGYPIFSDSVQATMIYWSTVVFLFPWT